MESQSITLRDANGNWLGEIVITSDGFFGSVTDWGNFSYIWRHYGGDTLQEFKDFLIRTNISYFGGKMYLGISYTAYGRKIQKSCYTYAEKILPPLQDYLKKENDEKHVQKK